MREINSSRGASSSKVGIKNRFDGYLMHHKQSATGSFDKLKAKPFVSLLTALVLAIALALPGTLYVAVENLQTVAQGVKLTAQMTVFLKRDASDDDIERIQKILSANSAINTLVYISPQEALAEFNRYSGFGDALDLLDSNPLPPVLLITPQQDVANSDIQMTQLIEHLKQMTLVDDVQVDMQWLKRLQAILQTLHSIAIALALALGLGVLLVVGNTIRMAIENRRDEIIVVKLIGGTDGYVRRPFLYTGFWYGLVGGFIAWLLVEIVLVWINISIEALAALYQSSFYFEGLGFSGFFALLAIGIVLGLGGAWLSVSQHLSQIEPK